MDVGDNVIFTEFKVHNPEDEKTLRDTADVALRQIEGKNVYIGKTTKTDRAATSKIDYGILKGRTPFGNPALVHYHSSKMDFRKNL